MTDRAKKASITLMGSAGMALTATPLFAFAGLIGGFFNVSNVEFTTPKFSVHESSLTLLKSATNIDPNPARGGADLAVVGGTALIAEGGVDQAVSLNESRTGKISLYVVRDGDSLSQVAQMFGVNINTIVWANNLKSATAISPGQTLVILPVSGLQHAVEKGETLASIAKKYKGDIEEIATFNGLDTDATLAIGTEIIIPGGEMAGSSTSYVGSKTASVKGAGGPTFSGYYTNPVPGSVRTQGLHGYNAVDLGARTGTSVVAAASGSVIISREGGWNGGYGNYIVISHENGTQTLYAHNSSNIVGVGQYVVKGQVIGYVGSTGRSTGPHVHFEVRGATNPFAY
ncbi:MAG: peptidoglycan DD-metalloendopeptidase family protein [Patescibacteria group bacterium UBA2103]